MARLSDLDRILEDIFDDILEEDVKKTATDLHRDLVNKSPVRDGEFRADWQLDISGKDAEVFNTKPYAQKLAEGSSSQAPNGWVDNAVDKAARS